MATKILRGALALAAAVATLTAGIAVNLGILSNGHWGPGGLTLGAAGVEIPAAQANGTTTSSIARRVPSSTTTRQTDQTTTTSTTQSGTAQSFGRRNTHTSSAPTPTAPPVTNPPPTTVQPKPASHPETTTTTERKEQQKVTFRVNKNATDAATVFDHETLKVRASVTGKLTVEDAKKSGTDVTLVFHDGPTEIHWRAWIKDGKVKTSTTTVRHDS